MSDVIDLSADLPADTAQLHILKPGIGEPNGWVITMAGPAHPKTLAYQDARRRSQLHKEAAIEAAQVNGRKYKPDEKTPEESTAETMRWVVSRIVSWTPIRLDGETIEFSDSAAIALLSKPAMGQYLTQIVDFITAERSFMPHSAKT